MTKSPSTGPAWTDWLWPLALAVTITLASGGPVASGPDIPHLDKVVHLLVFGLLATLIARIESVRHWLWLGRGWAIILTSIFGGLDEYRQSFTSTRYMEFGDWVADTLGAALAVTLYIHWTWYRRFLETPVRRKQQQVETGETTVPDKSNP